MTHDDRTKPFSDKEFAALARYPNGRIDDLPAAYPWITPAQRERLHEDDYSYMDELDEEVRIMLAEFGA